MAGKNITLFDVETGGLKWHETPITEIALVNFDLSSFKVNWEWQTYVKPYAGLKINPIVLEKTMVSMKDVSNGMESKDVVKKLIELFKQSNTAGGKDIGKTVFCGHNMIAFDSKFIEKLFQTEEKNVWDYVDSSQHDTMVMARNAWPNGEKNSLGECCKRIGYDLVGAHGAMADTRATFELFKYLSNRLRMAGGVTSVATDGTKNHRKYFNF